MDLGCFTRRVRREPRYANLKTMIVGVDVVLVAFHALAHLGAGIGLSLAGNVFVAVVIVLAPLLSLFLLHTRLAGMGALLLSLSMFGAFVFGVCGHFLLPGADTVKRVEHSVSGNRSAPYGPSSSRNGRGRAMPLCSDAMEEGISGGAGVSVG